MIAEIKGKINSQNTTLTELREDELTGNFFGNIRYIPFAKGLKKVFKNAIRPVDLQNLIDETDAYYWNDNLFSGTRSGRMEPSQNWMYGWNFHQL